MVEDRVQNAIERLTEICSDMKVMISAHEQRLNQSEKDTQIIFKLLEHRRKETDDKIDQVYNHMTDKDDKILIELKTHREASAKEHETISQRMTKLEKFIWLAVGGAATISWILTQSINFFSHTITIK
jgi:hypothetical protein